MMFLAAFLPIALVFGRCHAQADESCSERPSLEKAELNALKGPAELLGGTLQKVGGAVGTSGCALLISSILSLALLLP